MKNIFFVCICLSIGCLLSACSGETNRVDQKAEQGEVSVEYADVEKAGNNESDEINENVLTSQQTSANSSSAEPEAANVKAKVQVYEGKYFDENVYQYVDIPQTESPLIYCEIMISNITDTSFDFTIYETTMATDESKIIFPASTAVFIEDGEKAAYYGKEQTFYFSFPKDQASYPVITSMQIAGFEPLEGKTYMNNNIPGYEAG